MHRSEQWKYAFAGSRCLVCGFRHMPPTRACLSCHAIDQMQPERLADVPGTVATFTIDHLAYSLSPPVVGRDRRLRRWRPLPLRNDRRRRLGAVHRGPGLHDLPARVDGPGRAQLLLEGPSGRRSGRVRRQRSRRLDESTIEGA